MENIQFIQDLVQRGLNLVTAPSLIPSHILPDLKKIQAFLESESRDWVVDDALALLPTYLQLQGYEIGKRLENRVTGWHIQFPSGAERTFRGAAVLLVKDSDLEACQQWLQTEEYVFMIGCLWNELLSKPSKNRLQYVRKIELRDFIVALAVMSYRDMFAQTISAMPGAREEYLKALQQVLPQNWETISQLHARWLALVSKYGS